MSPMSKAMDEGGALLRASILISGRVQGVYFRAYAREVAQKQRLSGWVRNRVDGTVEAVVEGEETAARVTDVQVTWVPYKGDFRDFRILS
jgi:acylphosphatase